MASTRGGEVRDAAEGEKKKIYIYAIIYLYRCVA